MFAIYFFFLEYTKYDTRFISLFGYSILIGQFFCEHMIPGLYNIHIWVQYFDWSDFFKKNYCYFLVKNDEEEKEYKKKKLNKYLDASYEEVVRSISSDIANKYCSGCKFFNSPPFAHICLLSDIDKIDMFGKEALGIGIKSGVIINSFYDKSEKKFTIIEINEFINLSGKKKYKDVKKFFLLERI